MRPLRDTCPHIGNCTLARDDAGYSPELARIMRTQWCRADYRNCARFRIVQALGHEALPIDFFPAEVDRAAELIAAAE